MKKYILGLLILVVCFLAQTVEAKSIFNINLFKKDIVKNDLFAIYIPSKFSGQYIANINRESISIYDKELKKEGFGGFVFSINAIEDPENYAIHPGAKKLGELERSTFKGKYYDLVRIRPTEIQYDFNKYDEAPKQTKALYDLSDTLKIRGQNGFRYYQNSGTKGKELYGNVLNDLYTKVSKISEDNVLEDSNLSYMYNYLYFQQKEALLDKIGYTFYDINGDGIDELLIGQIRDDYEKGVIYDIYTIVNRTPKHVISGGDRDRYFVCKDKYLCNEYSSGAGDWGMTVYSLPGNSTNLYQIVSFKYLETIPVTQKDRVTPWYVAQGNHSPMKTWKKIPTQKEWENERAEYDNNYKRFDFTPLRKIK